MNAVARRALLCVLFACCGAASATSQPLEVLHSFSPWVSGPYGRPIEASDGNVYGTTQWGGAYRAGTIYRIDGAGVVTTLYSFDPATGKWPRAALLEVGDGYLYGTTEEGGTFNGGTVFR